MVDCEIAPKHFSDKILNSLLNILTITKILVILKKQQVYRTVDSSKYQKFYFG